MSGKRALFSLASIVFVGGLLCSCGGGDSGKGPESEMPIDGSADSWRNPTYHGALTFGVASSAEFNGTEFYHAWNFTLSGSADVSVWITPYADNFDTVMYFYRRDPGTDSWGGYVARNDDYQDNMWSRLDESLTAGEYRVMVKGYKLGLRGRFTVEGTCSGDGCAARPDCPEESDRWPAETSPAPSCVDKMLSVLTADVVATNTVWIDSTKRCDLPRTARLAYDYYNRYLPDEDRSGAEVSYTDRGSAGMVVGVTYGCDECHVTFLFNGAGDLVVHYFSNQSPEVGWYCKDPDEEPYGDDLWPGEFCVGNYLRNMTKKPADPEADSGTVSAGEARDTLPRTAAIGVEWYQQQNNLAADDSIEFSYSQWYSNDDCILIELSLEAPGSGKPQMVLSMGGDGNYHYLYSYTVQGNPMFICEEIYDRG